MSKTLIAFFSRADENYFGGALKYVEIGNTEVVVNQIKELISADTFKIEMKHPYSASYKTCIQQAQKDLRDNTRPELVAYPTSIQDYDTIILAYPNYFGTIPMAVVTFLEKFDFSGRRLLPLCTNEGSGLGSSISDLKKYAPSAQIASGLSIHGSQAYTSKAQLKAWLQTNSLL